MNKVMLFPGMFIFGILLLSCAPRVIPAEKTGVTEVPVRQDLATKKEPWQEKWDKIVGEAKRERLVVIYGPPIAEVRQGFTEAFQKRYPEIRVEYTGMTGAATSPKIKAERTAGLYVVDVYIGGTTTVITQLKNDIVPIKPFLLHPESVDPVKWLEGKLDFADTSGELNLVFTINATSRVVYNTESVKPQEITSWFDLLNPKWKGKINMWDPRAAGSGLATATFWYLNEQLKLDYIRKFAENKPLLIRDQRMMAERVARGKDYFTVASGNTEVYEFAAMGMPLIYADVLKEGTYSSAAYGSVAIMDRAPHPNAATVFLNWLLSREGQTIWSTKGGYVSRRLDVAQDHIPPGEKVKPGFYYQANYKEEIVMVKDEMVPYLSEIFKGF